MFSYAQTNVSPQIEAEMEQHELVEGTHPVQEHQ
jgi:hypothetical protein